MAAKHTLNGKAFEYACLVAFENKLKEQDKSVAIEIDDAFNTAKSKFEALDEKSQDNYLKAAETAVKIITPLEPQIEYGEGTLYLSINTDSIAKGPQGDVRDVMCIRLKNSENGWEVGFSCKHNHEGLKHPRITEAKDFGKAWLGYPCSQDFITKMDNIMSSLKTLEDKGALWRDIEDKFGRYYRPVLDAFIEEIQKLCEVHPDAPERFLKYFFGADDFYKIIAKEGKKQTTVEGFNMNGTLNRPAPGHKPIAKIAQLHMPTKLYDVSYKKKRDGMLSDTTIVMTFDEGWAISMRLHNKDDVIKLTGLSFEVELVGLANGMYSDTRSWDS